MTERLRLWLERGPSGYYLRDAATGEPVRWEDERIRVVPAAGVTYRAEALPDPSFDPGRRLLLVPSRRTSDSNAVAIWNEERTLQVGYVPREIAPELRGDEQAVSLWRVEGGLRVLIAATPGSGPHGREAHHPPGDAGDVRRAWNLAVRAAVRLLRRRCRAVRNPERWYEALDEAGALVGNYFEQKGDALEVGLGLRPT